MRQTKREQIEYLAKKICEVERQFPGANYPIGNGLMTYFEDRDVIRAILKHLNLTVSRQADVMVTKED